MPAHFAIEAPSSADLEVIHGYIVNSYWSRGIPRETLERSIANSICVIARDDAGALIGFARLVTDRATFGWVCDVFVLPAHQGQGVARSMLSTLRAHPELQGFKRWLLATLDAHGVYAGVEFKPLLHPERFMEVRNTNPYGYGAP
jgi:GNAT superfamily N-acetyltransferase